MIDIGLCCAVPKIPKKLLTHFFPANHREESSTFSMLLWSPFWPPVLSYISNDNILQFKRIFNNNRLVLFSWDHVVIIPCSMLQSSEGDAVILYCKVWWTTSIDVLLTSWIKMSDTCMSFLRSLGPNPKGWKPLFYSRPGVLTWQLLIR